MNAPRPGASPDRSAGDSRKAVGVYDRPPGADRAARRRTWLLWLIVLLAALGSLFWFLAR